MGSPLRLPAGDLSAKYGVSLPVTEAAFSSFDRGSALLLGFSGKIGAGKDSVAPLTFELLNSAGSPVRTDSFGADLKAELNGLIETVRDSRSQESCTLEIAVARGVRDDEAARVVELIYREVQEGLLQTAYDRTQGSRAALQYWATEVRRAQDPLYWVKSVIQRTMAAAAEGISTQITDVRFFTEVWGAIDAGGWTVRLDVSEAEQRRRILARDGIEVSEAAKNHSSETELDGFEGFSVRIQTDHHSSAESVARAAAQGVDSAASTLF